MARATSSHLPSLIFMDGYFLLRIAHDGVAAMPGHSQIVLSVFNERKWAPGKHPRDLWVTSNAVMTGATSPHHGVAVRHRLRR
jgi:hypothetical protein